MTHTHRSRPRTIDAILRAFYVQLLIRDQSPSPPEPHRLAVLCADHHLSLCEHARWYTQGCCCALKPTVTQQQQYRTNHSNLFTLEDPQLTPHPRKHGLPVSPGKRGH